MLLEDLNALTRHHMASCKEYADYVRTLFSSDDSANLRNIPYLPVRAFKRFDLKSVPDEHIYKVMRSSGTSGMYSRIYLDKETAQQQSRSLVSVFKNSFGNARFPMLVIDAESTIRDRQKFSARTAGINGFSLFSRKRCFALNDDMRLDLQRVQTFLDENKDGKIFVFGFTFLIWKALVEELRNCGQNLDLQNAFILHGGGWKKLEDQKVSNPVFKDALAQTTSCRNVHNYYGMVEQTGTIFMECEQGRLHAAPQSDVIIRDPRTHQPLPHGQTGLIQVFSSIQKSYPGHSLLTEDLGLTQAGEDCACGRHGTTVQIFGRLEKAEVRGCSDAYP